MKNKEITPYELIGLIKDNKAPKKIKVDNEIYNFHKGMEPGYILEDDKDIKLNFNYYIEDGLLNKKDIEILEENEKNDEWEEIEEVDSWKFNKSEDDIPHFELANIINKLIKNQKYLKERLDKDE